MPKYTYLCDKDSGGCGKTFYIRCSIDSYSATQTCPKCRKRKFTRRYYEEDLPIHIGDSSPKTIGSLADRNTSKLSNDEKEYIHKKNTAYRNSEPLRKLPDGMTRTRGKYPQ